MTTSCFTLWIADRGRHVSRVKIRLHGQTVSALRSPWVWLAIHCLLTATWLYDRMIYWYHPDGRIFQRSTQQAGNSSTCALSAIKLRSYILPCGTTVVVGGFYYLSLRSLLPTMEQVLLCTPFFSWQPLVYSLLSGSSASFPIDNHLFHMRVLTIFRAFFYTYFMCFYISLHI